MKKLLIPGFVAAIAIFIGGALSQYFFNSMNDSLSKEVETFGEFRSMKDPLMYIYFIYPLVLGYILAWLWDWGQSKIRGNKFVKVFRFTLGYWIIAIVPGMLMTFSTFKLSGMMIMSWTVGAFMQVLFASIAFSFLIRER